MDWARARAALEAFDLRTLFVEELGWDRYRGADHVDVQAGPTKYRLTRVAQKQGYAVLLYVPPAGAALPDYAERRRIHQAVARLAHEHLIVFADADHTVQVWQWVRRGAHGQPEAVRELTYRSGGRGEAVLAALERLAVTLEESDDLTIVDVRRRVAGGFDVDRISKRFYDRFKKERQAFHDAIEGIANGPDRDWYASVMLNRLMFVYFIQKKGFLAGDRDYLQTRFAAVRAKAGPDQFHGFYREFLLRLFFEGLGERAESRRPDLAALVGRVPYLNGGMFLPHQLEAAHPAIQIPDAAFERLFAFFDEFRWHLDERPLRAENEVNPDVLGYIFEKYVNQKQMGAYYTKEDITEYIAKYTVLPFLVERTREACPGAFGSAPGGGAGAWGLLTERPERYIPPAIAHGVDLPLPPEVAAGVAPATEGRAVGARGPVPTLDARRVWNAPAPETHGLATETWRDVVARRARHAAALERLRAGAVRSVADLVALNLNVRQFVQDLIERCDDPRLLRALWGALVRITVLDPTCGSGAFLFAALNVLEPLYEACLERMRAFVAEAGPAGAPPAGARADGEAGVDDFRRTLAEVAEHRNPRYFIHKRIVLNNLFGVDIMEEAAEICKLRLFLKLAAQVEADPTHPNLGIEPLPDIDFNIKAGNTLVGFATLDEARQAVRSAFDFDDTMGRITARSAALQQAFDEFRARQVAGAAAVGGEKARLVTELRALEGELNRFLAAEHGVPAKPKAAFDAWARTYQPFHWFLEFHAIMASGGFDVIVGNPPYLETREVDYTPRGYASEGTKAIHAMCMERSLRLLSPKGCISMIVPLSLPSTQRMQVVQRMLEEGRDVWYANYAWRPGKLFDTVNRALTIFVATPASAGTTWSTRYEKWTSEDRAGLFERVAYAQVGRDRPAFWVPKVSDAAELAILEKMLDVPTTVARFVGNTKHRIYYRTDGGLYWKVFTDFAPAFHLNGKKGHSSRETWFTAAEADHVHPLIAALSSDLFWWWYTVTSNVRHLNPYDVQNFPIPASALADAKLRTLGDKYLADIEANSTMLVRNQRQTGRTETQSFKIVKSKPVIDVIDRALAPHYGLTEGELDFIVNYDIKYRVGQDDEEE